LSAAAAGRVRGQPRRGVGARLYRVEPMLTQQPCVVRMHPPVRVQEPKRGFVRHFDPQDDGGLLAAGADERRGPRDQAVLLDGGRRRGSEVIWQVKRRDKRLVLVAVVVLGAARALRPLGCCCGALAARRPARGRHAGWGQARCCFCFIVLLRCRVKPACVLLVGMPGGR
jgi:hypothetical protein